MPNIGRLDLKVTGGAVDEVGLRPEPVVDLACRDCDEQLELRSHDPDELRHAVAQFLAAHPACHTTIDLARSEGLTFLLPRQRHAED